MVGRVVTTAFEREVISGVITDGTTGVVRAGSAAVRRAQTGFLRYYAALMIVCVRGRLYPDLGPLLPVLGS